MKNQSKKWWVVFTSIIIVIVPMIGALIFHKGHLPSGFFNFPPTEATEKPGFNLIIFILLLIACLFFVVLYIYPWIFGFKKPDISSTPQPRKKLPLWFYIGLVVSIADAYLLWGHFSSPEILLHWGFIPTIWGIVFAIDGIVYARSNGYSLFSRHPLILLAIAFCSAIGWGYFEYLSLFVGVNWYYPEAHLLSTLGFYVYAFFGGASLIPFVFQIYSLLNTFPRMSRRYSLGPKLSLNRTTQWILLLIGLVTLYLISYFPYILYPFIWLSPVLIISLVFDMAGLWTPFKPIAKEGNWTPLALIGLADLLQGLTCEMTNYLSATHPEFHTYVPGYWKYSIPYVDIWHVFEMPFEGLFGYLPYGIYNWVVWIGLATLLGVSDKSKKLIFYKA
jgi:hypothetical protein